MELLREKGPKGKVLGKVADLACVEIPHEVSHVEPAPEELEDDAQVKGLLEEEVNRQDAKNVDLRQEETWNHDVAADERDSRVKVGLRQQWTFIRRF